MAIAFYIPDQNKLLASYSGSNNNNNTNNNNNGSNHNNNNSAPTTTQTPQQQQPQQQQTIRQPHQQTSNNHSSNGNSPNHASGTHPATPNFRANITIPLAAYGNGRSSANGATAVGCWELFAQVFCYALGCYRATMLNPAAIQISFEISSSNSGAGFLTVEPTTTTTNAANGSNATTEAATTSTTSTTSSTTTHT